MLFNIKQSLKGCEISCDGETLIYEANLFSMTGKLSDSSGKTLAEMKRTGWLHYSFEIKTTDNHRYILKRKWGITKLFLQGSDVYFQTIGEGSFFSEKIKPITKFRFKKYFLHQWELEILKKEHWQALLIASCFSHRLDTQLT